MRTFERKEFLKLPAGTIYSRINERSGEFCYGLFKKTSGAEFLNDWVELEIVPEVGWIVHPENLNEGEEIGEYAFEMRDTFKDFQADYTATCRGGMYNEEDRFIVWDKNDIKMLINQLNESLL